MSGLYLLVVMGIWAGLTSLFIKDWRRWRVRVEARKWGVDVLCLLITLLWIGASFWYGGGRKIYYDTLVNRMCREDGGIKVYETVKLPAEKFDKYGVVKIPSRQDAKLEDNYYYDNETTFLQVGNPSLRRSHTRVVRRSDSKVLGEAVSYHRVGGDIPGPWHPSSFACPKPADLNLEKAIFIREVLK